MYNIMVTQWGTHMHYGRHICSRAYISNMKLCTNVSGHIIDSTEFLCRIYTNIVVSYTHMN